MSLAFPLKTIQHKQEKQQSIKELVILSSFKDKYSIKKSTSYFKESVLFLKER